jgi:hypothetical protein
MFKTLENTNTDLGQNDNDGKGFHYAKNAADFLGNGASWS